MTGKLFRSGDPFIWLSAGALALILVLLLGLFAVIFGNGLAAFWPSQVVEFRLRNGQLIAGEIAAREEIPVMDGSRGAAAKHRLQIKRGNRDVSGADFIWIDEADIVEQHTPPDISVIERRQWGTFYGYVKELKDRGRVLAEGSDAVWSELTKRLPSTTRLISQIEEIEKHEVAEINNQQDRLRVAGRQAGGSKAAEIEEKLAALAEDYKNLEAKLAAKRALLTSTLLLQTSGGQEKEIALADIVRAYRPNEMTALERLHLYASRLLGFVVDDPRESNTEGGVFPAIFGTVLMVILMSIAATPLGVLAAIYLHEYARPGRFVSLVRVAVNNLAGVPSIVFGVFGLGFFVYYVGGTIDRLFFSEYLPNPTFGTGGILWASLTLALLTMPTVIVATEEGLSAIPRSIREASYALGATKWETTWKVVLPSLLPSILTGLILAVARAAGEVAPLMITGVVKLAPTLPVDSFWPFIHLDRKFMHLGFHIYDVGFQSPNVDAARPVVYATTILLLLIVILLNTGAIVIRNRLRRKFSSAGV